jgi:hypothetical protein
MEEVTVFNTSKELFKTTGVVVGEGGVEILSYES